MDKVIEILRHPNVWAVSVQLLVLYCVSVGLFFSVDSVDRSITGTMKGSVKNGSLPSQLAVFALATALNALSVWTLVFVSGKLSTVPRLAMVFVPFLLLVEKHARAARADREQRRYELLLASGVTVGILAAAFALMRGCPIK